MKNTAINVLYLSYDGMTDSLGQSQVLPYLRGLSQQGYQFHLISFEKPDKFKKHRDHIQSICDQAGIVWHPQNYSMEGSRLTTWKQVRKMQKLAFELHEKYQFAHTHCRSYISALAGMQLKRKKGVKFVFDMRGFWADERVDGGLWDLKKTIYRSVYKYFKRKEIQFFKESDYVISLTSKGKDEIESWESLKTDKPKIKVIPCCVDLDLFDPKKNDALGQNKLKDNLGINETDYILGYVGSIGTWYMLPEMLDFFKVLKKKQPNAKFLFVTGEQPEYIKSQAKLKGLSEDDMIITSVLHHEVASHIALFDKSIFFIRPTFSKKASSPTKQGEIMAMGVPLYCNSGVGDTSEIVERYNAGVVIDDFNDQSYIDAIENIKEYNPKEISEGANAYFSLEEGVKRYLSVYRDIHA